MARQSPSTPLLASDLDGTLIPPAPTLGPLKALRRFTNVADSGGVGLAYVTGRHLELALEGIDQWQLPTPAALACDVGTSIYWCRDGAFELDSGYQEHIARSGVPDAGEIGRCLADLPGLSLQEPEKQARFKASFYLDRAFTPDLLGEIANRLTGAGALRLVDSYDPSTGCGLLDVLPKSVGKHSAVRHVAERLGLDLEGVIFAGDSGNDRDAILSGCKAIVVGNALPELKSEIRTEAERRGLEKRVFFASSSFAAGVLEGLDHFRELAGPA